MTAKPSSFVWKKSARDKVEERDEAEETDEEVTLRRKKKLR